MGDSAVTRLARELDGISERNAQDRELVALCDRLLLYLGEIERSHPDVSEGANAGEAQERVTNGRLADAQGELPMNDLSIKPAERHDLGAINEIRRAIRADQGSPYRLSDLEDYEIVGPERSTFVAVWKQGEAAIGYARVQATSPLKYADRADLEIYVAEHRRGGVVGRALLDRVVQHVHAATSVKTLVAKVHDDAPASRRFFERQGFKFASSDHPGSTLTLDIRNP